MERLVIEFAIRAALIAAAAAVVLRVLRVRAAAAQHAVWAGVLIVMPALPIWISWGPKAALPVLPARGEPVVLRTAAASNFPVSPPTIPSPLEITEPAPGGPVSIWGAVLIGAYLIGAGTLLLRLAIGTVRASRLTSASCVAPITVGLVRPRVILPECWREWPRAQLDAVFTHERAHARRRDPLVQWVALLNRALFWFHPLAWWLEGKLTALAEEACDAAVLEQGHDPREYSRYLLDLARAVERAGMRVNVTGMAMPGSHLPQRIKSIIGGAVESRVSPARFACAAAACAICSAMFAAGTLERSSPMSLSAIQPPAPLVQAISAPAEPTPKSARVLVAQAKAAAAQTAAQPAQSLPLRVRADYFFLTETSVWTNITIQIENKDLRFRAEDGMRKATVDMEGRITSADGQVVNAFEDPVVVTSPASLLGDLVKRASIYQRSVPLAPGPYRLNLVVRAVGGGANTYELALNVPRYDPEKLAVSSLVLSDVLQSAPASSGGGMFVIGAAKVRPRVTNVFHRAEKLGIYLQAYHFTPDPQTQKPDGAVDYEIENDKSQKVVAYSEPVNRIEGAAGSLVTIKKLLRLESLEPGQYTLRLKLTDNIKSQTVTTSASFTVN